MRVAHKSIEIHVTHKSTGIRVGRSQINKSSKESILNQRKFI